MEGISFTRGYAVDVYSLSEVGILCIISCQHISKKKNMLKNSWLIEVNTIRIQRYRSKGKYKVRRKRRRYTQIYLTSTYLDKMYCESGYWYPNLNRYLSENVILARVKERLLHMREEDNNE